MTGPYSGFGTKQTPQGQQVPGRTEQVKNNAGGYVFEVTPIVWLRRFLTIGTAGGTYYVGENALTAEAGNKLLEFTKTDFLHRQMVDEIVEISLAGRAPKQDPTLFALAIACQHGSVEAKQYARQQITKVVRTGTHLFTFVGYLKQFGGWSRGLRRAVGNWYVEKSADKLAYQMVKYRQREGYTHRDILRLTHPKFKLSAEMQEIKRLVELDKINDPDIVDQLVTAETALARQRATIDWTLSKPTEARYVPPTIYAFDYAQRPDEDVARILETHKLPWEALPDSAMNDIKVWDKLLDNDSVQLGALLRQLPRLTRMGMVPQMGGRTNEIVMMLNDPARLAAARIHPINVLVAMKTYASGRSLKGSGVWTPTTKLIDGLHDMFYSSFGYIEPTGKRILQAVDISGSMYGGRASENFPLCSAEVAAAMTLTTASVESNHHIVGFASASGRNSRDPDNSRLINLNISPRQRLDDTMHEMKRHGFGGTNAALPMIEARRLGWEIDTFIVYTDNETWDGRVHPFQALDAYRKSSGIDARLLVVAVTATHFTLADPRDPGMLDVCGFDSATPSLISEFSKGTI
jgi:60 kDa SS-A/Ro ribonucleoprotein